MNQSSDGARPWSCDLLLNFETSLDHYTQTNYVLLLLPIKNLPLKRAWPTIRDPLLISDTFPFVYVEWLNQAV